MTQNYKVEQLNNGNKVINFMHWNCLAFVISIILFILSTIVILLKDFNLGWDFTGGTIIEINLSQSVDINKIRVSLADNGYYKPLVQNSGSSKDIMIRLPSIKGVTCQEMTRSIISVINKYINDQAIVKRIEFVGPSFGGELTQTEVISFLTVLICILIYISFRFEWRFAVSIVISLIHNIMITLGFVSFFQIEVDMTIISSLMLVVGYSLNDNIVIFDRVRENFRKISCGTPYEVVNISLTQILSRTLITSGVSILAILILCFFGGSILKWFSLIILIGIIVGTVSSIYIASALVLKMGIKQEYLIPIKVEKEGANQYSLLP